MSHTCPGSTKNGKPIQAMRVPSQSYCMHSRSAVGRSLQQRGQVTPCSPGGVVLSQVACKAERGKISELHLRSRTACTQWLL